MAPNSLDEMNSCLFPTPSFFCRPVSSSFQCDPQPTRFATPKSQLSGLFQLKPEDQFEGSPLHSNTVLSSPMVFDTAESCFSNSAIVLTSQHPASPKSFGILENLTCLISDSEIPPFYSQPNHQLHFSDLTALKTVSIDPFIKNDTRPDFLRIH